MSNQKMLVLAIMTIFMAGNKMSINVDQKALIQNTSPALSAESIAQTQPQSRDATTSAAQRLEAKFTKRMDYGNLRKIVLADGWLPLVDPNCRKNVGGSAEICYRLYEVSACSGDGHCNHTFAHNESQTKLRVGTVAIRGGTMTKWWEFSPVAEPTNPKQIACPSQNFEEFLKVFASNKSVQEAFTLPLVKVKELVDNGDKGYSHALVYVRRSDYKDFDLVYKKDNFYYLNRPIVTNPIPVAIKQEAADSYFVKYRLDLSEGNSYRFKKQGGCWQLAEDPESPSP